MRCIRLTGKVLVEIGVAFPETGIVIIQNTRVADIVRLVNCVTPARKMVAIAFEDWLIGYAAGGPISLRSRCIAPFSVWVPVPGLVAKLGPKTVRQGTESGAEHRSQVCRRVYLIDIIVLKPINTCADCRGRAKRIQRPICHIPYGDSTIMG